MLNGAKFLGDVVLRCSAMQHAAIFCLILFFFFAKKTATVSFVLCGFVRSAAFQLKKEWLGRLDDFINHQKMVKRNNQVLYEKNTRI